MKLSLGILRERDHLVGTKSAIMESPNAVR